MQDAWLPGFLYNELPMCKLILLIPGFLMATVGYGQDTLFPDFVGKDHERIENTEGWEVLTWAEGDLNQDGIDDLSIILESADSVSESRCESCKSVMTRPRIILVLISTRGVLKVISQNNEFIARANEGGMTSDLIPSLSIKEGLLIITYEYVRSSTTYRFVYMYQKMILVSAEISGIHAVTGDFEKHIFNFQMGEMITITGNISREREDERRQRINVSPRTLAEFGRMYEWEILENIYL